VIFGLSHTMMRSSEGASLLRFLRSLNMNGVINLNKPAGPTSAAVVGKVKRLLPRGTKIGHAGTLDPFATGVLILLVGRATKLCETLMDQPKQYETTLKLGATTATDDLEATEIPWKNPIAQEISLEQIKSILPRFLGNISQRPPQFSAIRVGGRRAYDLARRGREFAIAPRLVRVDSIELLDYTWPLLRLRIDCGRGTYIRSLARDIGEMLEVGGYLTQLCRTRVGAYTLEDSVDLTRLLAEGIEAHLKPAQALL
jgi:tRNA pseudouridine55 synthase